MSFLKVPTKYAWGKYHRVDADTKYEELPESTQNCDGYYGDSESSIDESSVTKKLPKKRMDSMVFFNT